MRTPTSLDAVAEAHVDALASHNPLNATWCGLPGHDHELPDFSPEATGRWADELRRTLHLVREAPKVDEADEVTAAAMTERLGLELESIEAGDQLAAVNNIDSPIQWLRDIFDLMPTKTDSDWANVASRMAAMSEALDGYIESLREGISRGIVPARRAVVDAAAQAAALSGQDSRFRGLAAGSGRSGALRGELERAAGIAAEAFGNLGGSLQRSWLPLRVRPMLWGANATSGPPGSSSARGSTSMRPTNGGWNPSPRSLRNRRLSPGRSPVPRLPSPTRSPS